MSGSLNKVQIIGHLGQDPEIRTFQNGGKVTNLSVATSQRWKDRNTGEKRERSEWRRVAIFAEHAAGYAERYLRKGSKVYIEGQLETRKWQDQSGQDRYTTEVVVRPYSGSVIGLDRATDAQQGGNRSQGGDGYQGGQAPPSDLDDEIPF